MEQLESAGGHEEYRSALRTARFAKNILLWLIFLSLIVQLSGFGLARGEVIDVSKPAGGAAATRPATRPATAPVATAPARRPGDVADTLRSVYNWALPTTKFLAMAAGMLLVLTVLLSVKLSLVGRTGGVDQFLRAFFWSLLLWVFLIPWQQVLPGGTFACGALYNLGDLAAGTRRVTAENVTVLEQVLYYLRFGAYPVLVFVLWLMTHATFTRGYRRSTLAMQRAGVSGLG